MIATRKEFTALVHAIAERITGEEEKVFPAIPSFGRVLDQNGLRNAIRKALRNSLTISDIPTITAVTIDARTSRGSMADLMLDR